jgi:DNA-binding transcriptional LysR family regulator
MHALRLTVLSNCCYNFNVISQLRVIIFPRLWEIAKTGCLSIGFIATAMYDILAGALRIFRSACPMIHLNLEDMSSGQQIEALYGRKIDIGFVRPTILLSWIRFSKR